MTEIDNIILAARAAAKMACWIAPCIIGALLLVSLFYTQSSARK